VQKNEEGEEHGRRMREVGRGDGRGGEERKKGERRRGEMMKYNKVIQWHQFLVV